jgi:hypothetical protein
VYVVRFRRSSLVRARVRLCVEKSRRFEIQKKHPGVMRA